jgi:hypothetical protein
VEKTQQEEKCYITHDLSCALTLVCNSLCPYLIGNEGGLLSERYSYLEQDPKGVSRTEVLLYAAAVAATILGMTIFQCAAPQTQIQYQFVPLCFLGPMTVLLKQCISTFTVLTVLGFRPFGLVRCTTYNPQSTMVYAPGPENKIVVVIPRNPCDAPGAHKAVQICNLLGRSMLSTHKNQKGMS